MSTLETQLRALALHPDRRVAALVVGGLCLLAALVIGVYTTLLGPFFALGGGLALLAAVPMLRDVRWGLAATLGVAVILPFATLPFKVGITPTFLDLTLAAVYLVWILQIATGRRRTLHGSPLGILVAVFAVLAVVTFVAGLGHASPTATNLRRFAEILLGIGLFFVVADTLRAERDVRWLMRVLLLAGGAASAIAIGLYVIPETASLRLLNALGRLGYPTGNVLRYIEDDAANPMRAIGTSVDPNVLGGLLILLAALAAPHLLAQRPLLPRWLVAGLLGLNGLALYLTYSRGSMAGLAVGLAFVGVLRYRRLLVVLALVGALALLLPATQAYITHFIEGIQLEDRATQMRLGEYKDALILIQRYPWFGVGFTGTPDIDTYIGVSMVYLIIAEQMGLVGLAAFLLTVAVFFIILLRGWRRARRNATREPLLLGMAAAVVGLLAGGIFDHYLFNLTYPHMTSLFWLLLGMGVAISRLPETEEEAL